MKGVSKQDSRIELRLHFDQKQTIEEAAYLLGQEISEFIRSVMIKHSQSVIESHHNVVLSNRDRDMFLSLVESDEPPNQALIEGASWYKSLTKADSEIEN